MKETNDYGMYSGGSIFDMLDRGALSYIRAETGLHNAVLVTALVTGLQFKRQLCDKYGITVRCFNFSKTKLVGVLYTCDAELLDSKGNQVAIGRFTFTEATNHCVTV